MKNKQTLTTIGVIVLVLGGAILLLNAMANSKGGELKEITYEEITKKIEKNDNFILVVSQSTCSHCATYKPKVEQICREYGIDVYYIDYDRLDNANEFLTELDLSGATPMTLFFKNGKQTSLLGRIEGDVSKENVIEEFQKMGFIKK